MALRVMAEEDRYCIDVVTQINAAGAALEKVGLGLLDSHVRHCLIGGHRGPSDPDDQAEELMGAVGRMVSRQLPAAGQDARHRGAKVRHV